MLTPEARATIERELSARHTYVHGVHGQGPEHYLTKLRRGGWLVRGWNGAQVPTTFATKRHAVAHVFAEASECTKRINELRAQIELADFDAEMAATSPEERLASARAQHAAYEPRGWGRRKSA